MVGGQSLFTKGKQRAGPAGITLFLGSSEQQRHSTQEVTKTATPSRGAEGLHGDGGLPSTSRVLGTVPLPST